ncbi:MAG: chaperonin family protein RbcX [Leptolyngbyaceae cyanobacterium]
MDLKQPAKDAAKVLTSYVTYQAVKTVLGQLKETNPASAYWLNNFSSREALQDGERYLSSLLQENVALAMRVMTIRQEIAEGICEFLPEMVTTSIQQANMEHRRQHLERITQLGDGEHALESELPEGADVSKPSSTDFDVSPEEP